MILKRLNNKRRTKNKKTDPEKELKRFLDYENLRTIEEDYFEEEIFWKGGYIEKLGSEEVYGELKTCKSCLEEKIEEDLNEKPYNIDFHKWIERKKALFNNEKGVYGRKKKKEIYELIGQYFYYELLGSKEKKFKKIRLSGFVHRLHDAIDELFKGVCSQLGETTLEKIDYEDSKSRIKFIKNKILQLEDIGLYIEKNRRKVLLFKKHYRAYSIVYNTISYLMLYNLIENIGPENNST